MAILATGNTFATNDQVTATKLNNMVNNASFDSIGAVDSVTTHLSGGAIAVKDGGITPAKLSTGGPSWDANGNTVIGGTTTNDAAATGDVGEHVTATLARNASALSSGINFNVTSISLTAGDWDVSGMVQLSVQAASETISSIVGSISATSATMATQATAGYYEWKTPLVPSGDISFSLGPVRVSIASATTVYLVANATWSGGAGVNVGGTIRARRMR